MSVNQILDILILTLIWAGVGGAWNLLAGFAGQFSLGHAAFFGIGAYTSSILSVQVGMTPWLGIPVGAAAAALFAVVIGAVSLRTRGPFFTLMTIAFAEVLRIFAVYARGLTRGSEGLSIPYQPDLSNMIFETKWPYLALAAIYAVAVLVLCVRVRESRLGYSLLAIREDEDAARSVGVKALHMRVHAVALSAALTAVGGSLFAQYTLFIDPDSTMSFFLSVQPALITIVGGLGHPIGPLLGAIFVVPLENLLRGWFGGVLFGLHGFIYGIALIAVLLTLPGGLLQWVVHWLPRRRGA